MASVGVDEPAVLRVEDTIEAGDERAGRDVCIQDLVGLGQHLPWSDVPPAGDGTQHPSPLLGADDARARRLGDIAADTIVVIDGKILGKPKDEADAARMLRLLSGRRHEVMTGLTVLKGAQLQSCVVRTGIEFRALSEREIAAYVATGEPMDKAGAYGIQGRASIFVRHLDGDYFCVMGLPVCTLAQMLRGCGVEILGC